MLEIWSFGAERWGEAQADRYSAMLRHVAVGLLDFPKLGAPYPRRHGLYSIKAGEHRIVYRVSRDAIVVIRILHARMDPKRHLG